VAEIPESLDPEPARQSSLDRRSRNVICVTVSTYLVLSVKELETAGGCARATEAAEVRRARMTTINR
jgi:hypothetical protein